MFLLVDNIIIDVRALVFCAQFFSLSILLVNLRDNRRHQSYGRATFITLCQNHRIELIRIFECAIRMNALVGELAHTL